MDFFDIDVLCKRYSKYDTNHLHMFVDGNVSFPLNKMQDKDFGTFFHEYIHYLQHITTAFGLRMCTIYNRLFIKYRYYLADHKGEPIKLPLRLWEFDENIRHFVEHFNAVKGSKECDYHVDAVEVEKANIIYAKENKSAVPIGIYDFVNEKVKDKAFNFGYTCIIESMADIIQSFIDPQARHEAIPYKSVQMICKSKYPDFAEDKRKMVALCICALHCDNPGVKFFEILDEFNKGKNKSKTGLEFYKMFVNSNVKINNTEKRLSSLIHCFLIEYEQSFSMAIGHKLEYYSMVIRNSKKEARKKTSFLLEVLYSKKNPNDLSSDDFSKLVNLWGYPFIDSDNFEIFPAFPNTDRPYKETAAIFSWELLFHRLTATKDNLKCMRVPLCRKASDEGKKSEFTIECTMGNQWDKKEICPFTQALKYFKIEKSKFE
jgi:hypothetical protein